MNSVVKAIGVMYVRCKSLLGHRHYAHIVGSVIMLTQYGTAMR